MTSAILDSSVVLKWFRPDEQDADIARLGLDRFIGGELTVIVPTLINVEMVNVAARRWGLRERKLIAFARRLARLQFEVRDPDLEQVAAWTSKGLSAYDATYVALADAEGVQLVTADKRIVELAGAVALPLSAAWF